MGVGVRSAQWAGCKDAPHLPVEPCAPSIRKRSAVSASVDHFRIDAALCSGGKVPGMAGRLGRRAGTGCRTARTGQGPQRRALGRLGQCHQRRGRRRTPPVEVEVERCSTPAHEHPRSPSGPAALPPLSLSSAGECPSCTTGCWSQCDSPGSSITQRQEHRRPTADAWQRGSLAECEPRRHPWQAQQALAEAVPLITADPRRMGGRSWSVSSCDAHPHRLSNTPVALMLNSAKLASHSSSPCQRDLRMGRRVSSPERWAQNPSPKPSPDLIRRPDLSLQSRLR